MPDLPVDLIKFIDLTSLNASDNVESIKSLCQQANTPFGPVAAVCIFQPFVAEAKKRVGHLGIRIATVANFPEGMQSIPDCTTDIISSIANGADEIDVVLPYLTLLNRDDAYARRFLSEIRKLCKNQCLKVILETGELKTKENILSAAMLAIETGADFIKTSTGKTPIGATLPAVDTMLEAIKKSGLSTGIKISGGVATVDQAMEYLHLIEKHMGSDWITPNHVRFGASRLLHDILRT